MRSSTWWLVIATIVCLPVLSSCSFLDSSSDENVSVLSQSLCARLYQYGGTQYTDVISETDTSVRFTVGKELGQATDVPCSDTDPSPTSSESVTVYRIKELPIETAIAVDAGLGRKELFAAWTEEGGASPRVLRYIKKERKLRAE